MTVGLTFSPARATTRTADPSAGRRRHRAHERGEVHAAWCVQHGPGGCEGQVFSLPGTKLLLWLAAPTANDPRLVVEGPDGVVQLPVEA